MSDKEKQKLREHEKNNYSMLQNDRQKMREYMKEFMKEHRGKKICCIRR